MAAIETNILPLWDVLFGTFSAPERHELVGVGTVDDPGRGAGN